MDDLIFSYGYRRVPSPDTQERREREEYERSLSIWSGSRSSFRHGNNDEIRKNVFVYYPEAREHVVGNSLYFPAKVRKTGQVVFLRVDNNVGSTSDVFRALPEFRPYFAQIEPIHQRTLPAVGINCMPPVPCFQYGPLQGADVDVEQDVPSTSS